MKVKTVSSPTDIVIIGKAIETTTNGKKDWEGDFLLTDDYEQLAIVIDRHKEHVIETDGFVNIMTLSKYRKYRQQFIDTQYDEPFIFLPNYVGDINVNICYVKDKREDNVHITELDLDEYLCYQCQDEEAGNEWPVVYIDLPTNTEIIFTTLGELT